MRLGMEADTSIGLDFPTRNLVFAQTVSSADATPFPLAGVRLGGARRGGPSKKAMRRPFFRRKEGGLRG